MCFYEHFITFLLIISCNECNSNGSEITAFFSFYFEANCVFSYYPGDDSACFKGFFVFLSRLHGKIERILSFPCVDSKPNRTPSFFLYQKMKKFCLRLLTQIIHNIVKSTNLSDLKDHLRGKSDKFTHTDLRKPQRNGASNGNCP